MMRRGLEASFQGTLVQIAAVVSNNSSGPSLATIQLLMAREKEGHGRGVQG